MTISELETRANSEAGASLPPAPAGRGRFPRWLLGACLALAALALLVVAAVWIVIAQIDRPWVKSRVVAYARDSLGLGIDYEGLELSLVEGVRFRSFRLLTPAALAAGADDFVRVDDLELRARLWTFVASEPAIESLRVGNVELALVTDASGRTTTSELFPPGPETETGTDTRLSQALRELPSLSIAALDVAHVGVRMVELSADGSRRVLGLTNLGMRGALALGEEGLSGTALALSGAPLALELGEQGRVRRAALGFDLDVRSTEPQAAALDLRVALKEQDLAPGWTPRGDLLALKAMLRFDELAGRTSIAIETLRALGGALSIEASSELYDGEGLKVVTSGKARIDMVALPVPIEGVTLDSLVLDLSTRELSWDGARVGGDIDWNGRLSSLTLGQAGALTRLRDLKLLGHGVFEGQSGRFDASATVASAESSSPGSRVQAAGVGLSLRGTARELDGAQQLDGEATLALVSAQARAEGGSVVDVEAPTLRARASGTAAGLAAQILPVLEGDLAVKSLRARSGSDLAVLANLTGTYALKQLALDASAELGVQGDAALSLSLPALRVFEGARAGRPALSVAGVELSATLPLSLARAGGTVSVDSLRAGERSLDALGLELELASPLGWSPERAGGAEARLSGSLGRFDAGGGSRGSLRALRVLAQKQEGSRYRLELDAQGSSLALGGVPVPGQLSAELRADAQPADGALTGSAALWGERGAEVLLGLDAKLDRSAGRVRYSANVSAEKLEAFAELASSLDPRAAQVELAGARLTASARGDLAGVLRQGGGLVPELVERPLGTARGTQSAKVFLRGLDYRGADRSLQVPELALDIESTHRAERGGNASARLRLPELRLEGGGTSLRLSGLSEELVATFERAPDQGMVDVRSSLELASAAQSWLPGYPVRDLRLSGNVQIDRLRSIFLRELTLENPASGSALRAEGTLELLAQGNGSAGSDGGVGAAAARDATERSAAAGKTIAGRQALSFEGRLTQQLAPLEGLELASHASGSLELPFRLESGGLLGYRLLATIEAKQISFVKKDGTLAIEKLNGRIPVVEEFALLPNGPVLSAGPRTSPLSDTRFFDVHPFLSGNDYVTAESITFGGIAPLGPVAANVRIERSDFVIDQLQTGYSGGQIVGQVRAAFRDGDPIVRLRLNATGVRSGKSRDVFDANMALSFVPAAMTLDGKVQIVRASREHLEDILNLLDPFHESANANRVRRGLTLGYPKFVRFQLHDGAVDTKVELGGIAQLIRIDEIRAVPLGPILQKYVAPTLAAYWRPAPERPTPPPADVPVESARREDAAGGAGALLKPRRDSAPRVKP